MRVLGALCLALGVAACATPETTPDTLPPNVDGGLGSQFGNYAAVQGEDITNAEGEHCVVWNWDRPISGGLAVRIRSASCPSQERPGRMVAVEVDRTVIPLAASNLAHQTP